MHDKWRLATLAALAAFLVALVWGLGQMRSREAAENELASRYQQAFFDAVGHVENVEVLLSKGLAATTPEQLARVFGDLKVEAAAAQSNLTQIPLGQGTLMRTSKFLTQVGDFARTVAASAAAGAPPTSEMSDLIARMQSEATLLSAALHQIQQEAAAGRMPWEGIRSRASFTLRRKSQELDDSGFTRLEAHFQEIPVIQYDGPFSDHVLQREPRGLVGAPVSEAEAEQIALNFVDVQEKEKLRANVVRRVEGSDIPAYGISVAMSDDQRPGIVMDVSMRGGHVVWMLDPRIVTRTEIGMEEAVRRAQAFLEARGYGRMVPTYAMQADHRAVIPFVPEVDGVLIYPDLVKVTVALDDGSIVGFEALGYLMSHTERELPAPRISAAEARERVDVALDDVGEPRLALIPLETLDEALTWEVPASNGEERFLVYIDVETGREQRILRLVQTEEGDTAI